MIEQRYQAVLAVISDGETVSSVAARFGVHRKTLHGGLARYECEGLEGPADRSHRPRSCPHPALPGGNMFAKVVVAGDLFHTRLGRGEVHTQRVHQFNDAGDELLEMVTGTAHPMALASICGCESGRPFGECCGVDAPAAVGS